MVTLYMILVNQCETNIEELVKIAKDEFGYYFEMEN